MKRPLTLHRRKMMNQEELKRMSGVEAAKEVKDGQIVGLGTGSTVYYAIKYLGALVRSGDLEIKGIGTSIATEKLAREEGIPLISYEEHQVLDIAIDGADQVDPGLNLIKGGGGAHVREKIVASTAKRFIVVADESKLTPTLDMAVPIEVLPFAKGLVIKNLEKMGAKAHIRMQGSEPRLSDNYNYIADADFGEIENPRELEKDINNLQGVVDNGIFTDMTTMVYVGTSKGVKTLRL